MFCFFLYLAALSMLTGTTATSQTFTNSGEMNISSCPITYYGQKYDKVYVSNLNSHIHVVPPTVIITNTTVKDPKTCSTVTCNVNGVADAISYCGPMERCQGDGRCVLNTICTVTGSTVIDFVGRVRSVPDRCGYTLMRPSSIPGLQVLGVFQERRRKDVSFLDRVILQLDQAGVQISLEQGGRVQLNNKVLMLNATAQVVHGVELSKDQMGVTAKISASNHTVSVLFDGSVTLIHMTGPSGAHMPGLCGNSSRTLSKEKVSEYSATGCEIQYDDAADSTIDCNATTEWCNLLKQAPFTACSRHIDPEPFTTACTRTLCKYPAVDGLKCQFLEAYARACTRHSNVTVEGWRSKTSCCKPDFVTCQDRFCSAHEFCGESNNGAETRCLCRAIFASKYKSTGEPTVCGQKSASLTLAKCLLEDKSIDYSVLHLNDQTCTGEMDNLTHMVMFSFDSSSTCGTVVTANNSQIIYKNTIMTRNSSMFGLINRQVPVHIDFSCFYSQPDVNSLAIKLKHRWVSVIQQITSGEWSYNLSMKAYASSDRVQAIQSSNEIQLDEKIWVELKTDGLNEKMVVVVTDSCWATDQPSPSGSLRYDLIIKGCPNPADQTVKVEGNGLGTSNYFSFNTFQFSGKTGDVYLHCRVELCVRQGNTCTPV
uniref:Uncharacterized LOC111218484 n=1 Tax=Seriola dumerili TaxID=41447 RepID=A0A3B4USC7_SERDU